MVNKVGYFLLDELLWSITWGIYHVPITIIIMSVLLYFFCRMGMIRALVLSTSANAVSVVFFTLISTIFSVWILKLPYPMSHHIANHLDNAFVTCVYLGLLYAFVQMIFFIILHTRYRFALSETIMVAFISNLLAALVVYVLLPSW